MDDWITGHKIPLGAWLKSFVDFLNRHAQGFFDFVTLVLGSIIDALLTFLLWFPPLVLIALLGVGAYFLHRSIALAVFVVLGLLLVINLGYWEATLETLTWASAIGAASKTPRTRTRRAARLPGTRWFCPSTSVSCRPAWGTALV